MGARLADHETGLEQLRMINAALVRGSMCYVRLVEAAGAGIWVVDADDRTAFVNAGMAAMLGYSIDDILGQPLAKHLDEAWKTVLDAILEECRHGMRSQHELPLRRRSGARLWTMVSATPILDEGNRYSGALAVLMDIGDLKDAEMARRMPDPRYRAKHAALDGAIQMVNEELWSILVAREPGRMLDEYGHVLDTGALW
jgi:PAS domain S-box-containing protein